MEIAYLADHIHLAPTLARWHFDEWGDYLPFWSYEAALAELLTHNGRSQIPTTFIALEDGELLGSASLLTDELDEWQHLTPWIGSVYIASAHRGKGVGKGLAKRIIAEASALGATQLYLYTFGQAAYWRQLGWSVVKNFDYYGRSATLMSLFFAPDV